MRGRERDERRNHIGANTVGARGAPTTATARFKGALQLSGLDLREHKAYLSIPEELPEFGVTANGPVSCVTMVKTDLAASEMVSGAADCARSVGEAMPGVRVVRVYEELVGYAQIASRCAVAPESGRLWATGRRRATDPFPDAREAIALGSGGTFAAQFA